MPPELPSRLPQMGGAAGRIACVGTPLGDVLVEGTPPLFAAVEAGLLLQRGLYRQPARRRLKADPGAVAGLA